jgi:hypothetical protein
VGIWGPSRAARFAARLARLRLRLLRRVERLLQRFLQRAAVHPGLAQCACRLALRLGDGARGALHRLGHVLRRLALGAQHLRPGLAQVVARGLQLLQGTSQLLAPHRVLRVLVHLLHDAARQVDRPLREGEVDLALDGTVLLRRGAALVEPDEMEGRGEDRQPDGQQQAAPEEGPPRRAMQQAGE